MSSRDCSDGERRRGGRERGRKERAGGRRDEEGGNGTEKGGIGINICGADKETFLVTCKRSQTCT